MKKYYPKQSRKIRNLFLPLLFLSLLQIGCSKDMYDDPNGKDKSYNSNNVLSEIRSFFEDNATDLQPVDFNFDVKTKSSTRVSNITPAWDGAVITRKDSITNVEIPLSGDFSKLSRIIRRSSTHKAYGFISGITTKLVIQKHERTNHFRQFVVTMIDDFPQARKNNKIRNYSGKSDFSGYIIISSLEGRYLESFRSINGVWSRVYMEPSSGKEPENSAKTTSLRMLSPESTPKTYSFGEMDTYCSVCTNPIGLCSCCKACNGSYWGCSECQVIIYPDCRKCGNRTNECVCCSWCKNYPCTCYTPPQACPDCNRVNCICSSFICSKCGLRYCNGSCQSSGGGGGGGTTPPTDPNISHPSYIMGKAATEKMLTDLENRNVKIKQLNVNPSTGEALLYAAGVGVNVNSIAPSVISMIKSLNSTTIKNYGTGLGAAGVLIGGTQTIIALIDEDGAKMSTGEILNAISTGLTAVGLLTPYFAGVPVVAVITGVAGVAGAIVGIIANTYTSEALIIKIPLKNGGNIVLHIPANAPSPLIC